MSAFRDVINVYKAKREEAEAALKATFFFWVNAPDDESDRQGYLFLGSVKKHQTEKYEMFRSFVIGARSADMRDVEELLAYGDSEARTQYSEEGDDYHAIVGARTVSEYFKIILRAPDEPVGLATEVVLRDTSGELIAIHYDGEYERIQLDRKFWWKYLGGSRDPAVSERIKTLVERHLRMDAFHPDQTDGLRDDLRRAFPELSDIQRWRINYVINEDPKPDELED
jgi:hypothetical protein